MLNSLARFIEVFFSMVNCFENGRLSHHLVIQGTIICGSNHLTEGKTVRLQISEVRRKCDDLSFSIDIVYFRLHSGLLEYIEFCKYNGFFLR